MRIVRPVVQTVGSLSIVVRDIARMRQVTVILAKHGLGLLIKSRKSKPEELSTTPKRFVTALQELGPTFIKFGQILSTRPDVVPADYIAALQTLQDSVVPLPFSEIDAVLQQDIGSHWEDNFRSLDKTPLATASIAQVHRAILHDGREVVLKVQRPKVDSQIRSDLSILRFILERAIEEFPEIELFDPRGMFQEFQKSITSELDFTREVKNLKRFRKNFATFKGVVWPEPISRISTRRVLCMEFLDGISIREARQANRNMTLIGNRYLEVAYSMLFEHGFFHGDLHPGNVLVLKNDVIGILDCGMVGRLSEDMKDSLAALLFGLFKGDARSVARTFFDIAIKQERVDFAAFERDTMEVVEEHWSGSSFAEMNIGAFLMDITQRAMHYRVRASPAFTMFFKGVMTTEGLAKSLLPEVDPLAAAQPYVEKLIRNRWHPKKWSELGTQNIMSYSAIAKRLPISITQFLDDLDRQQLHFAVTSKQSDRDRDLKYRLENTKVLMWISISWMIVGMFGLLLGDGKRFEILSITMFLLAFLMQLFIFLRFKNSA